MKIAIAGGTGFIGQQLTEFFLTKGYHVYILTRSQKTSSEKNLHYMNWLNDTEVPIVLETFDVVINLAGKSINDRWTDKTKNEIVESRVRSTNALYSLLTEMRKRPTVYINASAIGIYGTSLDKTFTEASTTEGHDFLANTVKKWEKEAAKVNELHVRTVYMRFGIVLGEEGALPKMLLPFKLFAGGKLGSGHQWMSWIHISDLVKLIDHVIHTPGISGPVNATSPNPVKMNEFSKTIAYVLNKPYWLPVPAIVLKTLLGEMSILILEGQKVLPQKALEHQFQFLYPNLDKALSNLL